MALQAVHLSALVLVFCGKFCDVVALDAEFAALDGQILRLTGTMFDMAVPTVSLGDRRMDGNRAL